MDTVVNGNHIVMADVIAIALCWQMLLSCIMLADVMPWICSRCYCHIIMLCCVVDGKALVADVWSCVFSKWQMLLPQMEEPPEGGLYFNLSSEVLKRTSSRM